MLDELVYLKQQQGNREADRRSVGESSPSGTGFGTRAQDITVDDLKMVGLEPKEKEAGAALTTGDEGKAGGADEKIPPSAAVVAPSATPPAEEIPQSVIDATAAQEEEPGVVALANALRKVHQRGNRKPAEPDEAEAPAGEPHAESFDEMGGDDYRKLMLEARSGKRS
jgi:hypothetical protein